MVRCPDCGVERWAGIGPCSSCLDPATTRGELPPEPTEYFGTEQVVDEDQTLLALQNLADQADPTGTRYLRDPVGWAREKLGYELWSRQRQIVEAVRDHHQVAVHSCHAAGKSLTAAVTAMWWIDAHPVGEAFVVTTAPTQHQVQAVLWREMNRLHARAHLGGRMNLLEWYFGNELVAFGRKPQDYNPEAFQGIHSIYVLVVLDEACGITKELWDALSTLAANDESRLLAIGNPDYNHGEFARVCLKDPDWHTIQIGAKDTPNFTGEDVAPKVAASLISERWVEERRRGWGEGSALFKSKVMGEFADDADTGVIPHSWAMACKTLQLPAEGVRAAGLDVGGGGDRTVLRERVGPRAGREEIWVESDPMKACGAIALKLAEWDIQRVVVDVIGIGWGLAGRLKELSKKHNPTSPEAVHRAEVVTFNSSETSNEPARFLNKRAEIFWEVGRELSRLRTWDLENVEDDVIDELTEAEYVIMDSKGKIKVEPKEEIKKRTGGKSPDRADALLMAYWEGSTAPAVLPVPARILTGIRYDQLTDFDRPGWAGPTPDHGDRQVPVSAEVAQHAEEERLMRELMLSRRV